MRTESAVYHVAASSGNNKSHLPDAKSSLQQRNDSWCKKQCSSNFTLANVVFIHAQSWSKENWHSQSCNKHRDVVLQQRWPHCILIMWCLETQHMPWQYYLSVSLSVCHTCIVSVMAWAIDTTGLIIITSGTCCGQEAQSVNDTYGGRSGTRSCWWMVDQICANSIWPPTPECIVLQTLLQLTCMRNANQFCPSWVFPVQRVWCHTESLWSLLWYQYHQTFTTKKQLFCYIPNTVATI